MNTVVRFDSWLYGNVSVKHSSLVWTDTQIVCVIKRTEVAKIYIEFPQVGTEVC